MAFASGAGTRVAFVKETEFGVTPDNPAFQELRVTGAGLGTTKMTGTSDELNADRNIRDIALLGLDSSGEMPFEFSYKTFDDLLAGALFSEWAGDVLKNGVLPQSLTFEQALSMGGAARSYFTFSGVMVDKFNLKFGAREMVKGSVNLFAQKEKTGTVPLPGATYLPPNTEPVATASANVAELVFTGFPSPKAKSLSLTINNNLRTRPVVGQIHSEEFGYGRCDVGGDVEVYFSSLALYEAVREHREGSLSWVIGSVSGKKYRFTIPRFKFGTTKPEVGGNDSDIMLKLPWNALYDNTEQCALKIERNVA